LANDSWLKCGYIGGDIRKLRHIMKRGDGRSRGCG
jgi:hypothetical protein